MASFASPAVPERKNYAPSLVEWWGDFIDWKKRRKGENGFLERTLWRHGARDVFEAALGDGCDAIHLLKNGFRVVANEIDSPFIERALLNAYREGVKLKITNHDWLELDRRMPARSFDAITLMGNSFSHLFRRAEQLRTLRNFRHLLRPGGTLLIDERNFQYLLDSRKDVLHGNFRYSGKYVYCGTRVRGFPIAVSNRRVVFRYQHEDGRSAELTMHPLKRGELRQLLREAGFARVRQYSDYKPGYNSRADFHQYVARA